MARDIHKGIHKLNPRLMYYYRHDGTPVSINEVNLQQKQVIVVFWEDTSTGPEGKPFRKGAHYHMDWEEFRINFRF